LRFSLFSIDGRCLKDQRNPVGFINVHEIPSGLYFYQLLLEGGATKSGKWVKGSNTGY
jgi:ribosomal protein S4E